MAAQYHRRVATTDRRDWRTVSRGDTFYRGSVRASRVGYRAGQPWRWLRESLEEAFPSSRPCIDSKALFVTFWLKGDLRQVGVPDVKVYSVDDWLDVPAELVLAAGYEVGARGRVATAAAYVSRLGVSSRSLSCVIDADWSTLDLVHETCDHLLLTDVGSMDAYCLNRAPTEKLLALVLARPERAEVMLTALLPALNELFALRYALHTSALSVPLLTNFTSCCSIGTNEIAVNSRQLIERSLSSKGHSIALTGELLERTFDVKRRLPENRLLAVRGHDAAPLVVAYLRLRNEWARSDVLERAWRGCLEVADLEAYPMFRSLTCRVSA
jgi:hypothetical protein